MGLRAFRGSIEAADVTFDSSRSRAVSFAIGESYGSLFGSIRGTDLTFVLLFSVGDVFISFPPQSKSVTLGVLAHFRKPLKFYNVNTHQGPSASIFVFYPGLFWHSKNKPSLHALAGVICFLVSRSELLTGQLLSGFTCQFAQT